MVWKEDLVLCHNDLLINNVLLGENNQIYLIDFEYVFHNVFLSDIYNMLIESTYDYNSENELGYSQDVDKFGSREEVQYLIASYLYFKQQKEEKV